jgi:hypothetical protein
VCNRCKATYYKSKAAQKANWYYHKETCSAAEPEFIDQLEPEECVEMLMEHFEDIEEMNGNTVLLLKRVRHIIDEEMCPKEIAFTIGLHFHTLMRRPSCEHYFNKLWAVPGKSPDRFLFVLSLPTSPSPHRITS